LAIASTDFDFYKSSFSDLAFVLFNIFNSDWSTFSFLCSKSNFYSLFVNSFLVFSYRWVYYSHLACVFFKSALSFSIAFYFSKAYLANSACFKFFNSKIVSAFSFALISSFNFFFSSAFFIFSNSAIALSASFYLFALSKFSLICFNIISVFDNFTVFSFNKVSFLVASVAFYCNLVFTSFSYASFCFKFVSYFLIFSIFSFNSFLSKTSYCLS
jgi:hypothetical protein